MKLNSNSLSARLYKSFYSTKTLPNNSCPYFRKLVLAWLLAIPCIFLTLPPRIMSMVDKDMDDKNNIGIGIAIWSVLFIIYCMFSVISLFFIVPVQGTFLFFSIGIGIFCIFVITMYLIIRGLQELIIKIKDKKEMKLFKEPSTKESSVIK
jgi:hypothetical protein